MLPFINVIRKLSAQLVNSKHLHYLKETYKKNHPKVVLNMPANVQMWTIDLLYPVQKNLNYLKCPMPLMMFEYHAV